MFFPDLVLPVVDNRWGNIAYKFWELLWALHWLSYMNQHWNILYIRTSKTDTTGAVYGKLKLNCDILL